MTGTLTVTLQGARIGDLHKDGSGRHHLVYDRRWTDFPGTFPVSVSMPLTKGTHSGAVVENWLWNLLPDSPETLAALGRDNGVSVGNVFDFVKLVGADCAGAFRFVDPALDASRRNEGAVEWIDDGEMEARLKRVREERTWTGRRQTEGRFSLAGAQPKTALLMVDGRWGVPSGATPTTHILKPPLPGLSGTTENEHVCLTLASRLGIPAARSEVGRFGDETAIVVTRYDRQIRDGVVQRIHQEDFCQALGVHPSRKYQRDGGPSPEDMARALNHTTTPRAAVSAYGDALVLNFLIGGTDAHAKNHSILHLPGRKTRFAPLYDVLSYDPHVEDRAQFRKLKMAQKIGDHYAFEDVMPRHWEKLAAAVGLDAGDLVGKVTDMAERIPHELASVVSECRSSGLDHPVLDAMLERISDRCDRVARVYGMTPKFTP